MQDEVKEKLFREYLEAEALAEEKLAESLRTELDPMELDTLLASIATRAPFFSHPLAKHRLGFSESQANRLKAMVLSRAAISAKVIEGIDLSKGLPKQIDFGLNYATEKAKILSVLSEDQLAEYLQLVGAFEKGSTAREYILKLDYGAYVLEPIEKMVDSIDKKR
jgi:predicted NACHT family NTPase